MDDKKIHLGHGSGGRLARELIEEIISPVLGSGGEYGLNDSAVLGIPGDKLAFTTDSYIIDPIFFPGGDIGKLAVCGTVNDLLMSGAKPLFLTLALIIEEGFPLDDLKKILNSIRKTADSAGVRIATGDTKILPRGKGDGIFINTAGIGEIGSGATLSPDKVKPGDKIILTGSLGDHSTAVMVAREKLAVSSNLISDCAHLSEPVLELTAKEYNIKCMRDPTRGGLAGVLTEIADEAGADIILDETSLPVSGEVRAVCEVLGLDPLYMANEGKAVIFTAPEHAESILDDLKKFEISAHAALVGEVTQAKSSKRGRVVLKTVSGGERIILLPMTEQLPRIC